MQLSNKLSNSTKDELASPKTKKKLRTKGRVRPAAKRLKLHTVCSSTYSCDTGTGKSDVYDADLKDVNKSADYTVPKHVDIQPSSISVMDVGQVKKDQIQSSTTLKKNNC